MTTQSQRPDVVEVIAVQLIGSDASVIPVSTEFSFRANDPYTVRAVFSGAQSVSAWLLGRELLADDRPHQRPVVLPRSAVATVLPVIGPDGVDQLAQHRIGRAQVIHTRCGHDTGGTATRSGSPSRAPNARASEQEMHVNVGVSRRVYELDSVVRSRCTRSRKSAGLSVSNATTNSWSSRPNE